MNLWNETKSVPVSKEQVWNAYKKVRSKHGSAGIDQVSMEEFDADRSKHLYKLWNRMASGSYFPPPVKEVEIPRKDGKVRKLGISTISDRVAQMVVKEYLEPRFEKIFSPHSYGYRPDKSAHQALKAVQENSRKMDWVIDLDIKGYFDNIEHDKLMLALKKHDTVKFDFLGYSFQPRTARSKKTGKLFLGYGCAISISSKKQIAGKMEELDIVHLTHKSIVGVAQFLEPYIRGWVNYYGKFRQWA
jgi:RNA-directed DNA polymerase